MLMIADEIYALRLMRDKIPDINKDVGSKLGIAKYDLSKLLIDFKGLFKVPKGSKSLCDELNFYPLTKRIFSLSCAASLENKIPIPSKNKAPRVRGFGFKVM